MYGSREIITRAVFMSQEMVIFMRGETETFTKRMKTDGPNVKTENGMKSTVEIKNL